MGSWRTGLVVVVLACGREDPSLVARRAALASQLDFPGLGGSLDPVEGAPVALPGGGSARPVSYEVLPGFRAAAALFLPAGPAEAGVIVAQGHFGAGKNSGEAQEVAIRLAEAGIAALAVDTPGVEEWDLPGRQIHFEAGAHNRAFLAAGGSSALALQLAVLRRGLDLLAARGMSRFAATGASGGAVQSFYLQMIDPRVRGSALASVPPMPREARAGGCACDQIPGVPGPDPGLLAALPGPALWMSDTVQPRPDGLPRAVEFEVFEGPHSYTLAMQARALAWLERLLDVPSSEVADEVPAFDLHTADPDSGPWKKITDLDLHPTLLWTPRPHSGLATALDCAGEGPVVLVGGGQPADREALLGAGFRACELSLLDADPVAEAEAMGRGLVFADAVAGAWREVAQRERAVAVWGVRGWGIAAAGTGLPFVVRDPLREVADVDPARDPSWVHVPGAWWGALAPLLGRALAMGEDPEVLAEVVKEAVGR